MSRWARPRGSAASRSLTPKPARPATPASRRSLARIVPPGGPRGKGPVVELTHGPPSRTELAAGTPDRRVDRAARPFHGARPAALRRRLHGAPRAGWHVRVRCRPGALEDDLHDRARPAARRRGELRSRARAGQSLRAAPGRCRAHPPATPDAAALPRRAAARLRGADRRDRGGGDAWVAQRRAFD